MNHPAHHQTSLHCWQYKIPLILVLALVLQACGGSSPGQSGQDPINSAVANGVAGTVVLEERGGKLVIDAWFVPRSSTAATAETQLGSELCNVSERLISTVSSEAGEPNDRPFAESFDIAHTLNMGEQLVLASANGPYAIAQATMIDGGITYATEQHWFSEALPDDVVLDIPGTESLSGFSSVPMRPLAPLTGLVPADGFLQQADDTVQWDAGDSINEPDVGIRLLATTSSFEDLQTRVVDVNCLLEDDGHFVMPASVQNGLPEQHNGIVLYLLRQRITEHVNGDSRLSIVQSSHL